MNQKYQLCQDFLDKKNSLEDIGLAQIEGCSVTSSEDMDYENPFFNAFAHERIKLLDSTFRQIKKTSRYAAKKLGEVINER